MSNPEPSNSSNPGASAPPLSAELKARIAALRAEWAEHFAVCSRLILAELQAETLGEDKAARAALLKRHHRVVETKVKTIDLFHDVRMVCGLFADPNAVGLGGFPREVSVNELIDATLSGLPMGMRLLPLEQVVREAAAIGRYDPEAEAVLELLELRFAEWRNYTWRFKWESDEDGARRVPA